GAGSERRRGRAWRDVLGGRPGRRAADRGVIRPGRAAGGIVLRDGRVLVVHRPRYDDWSLPKGKLRLGESWQAAALREVEEETGLRCRLGELAGSAPHGLRGGRYFRMAGDGGPRPPNAVAPLPLPPP